MSCRLVPRVDAGDILGVESMPWSPWLLPSMKLVALHGFDLFRSHGRQWWRRAVPELEDNVSEVVGDSNDMAP